MSIATEFQCEACGERYRSAAEADECAKQPEGKPLVSVGNIVLLHAGFGWFDGDPAWVENLERVKAKGGKETPCPNGDRNCFGPCCTYQFYYVVTAIDWTRGSWRYHVRTGAMQGAYGSGWTMARSHHTPRLADPKGISAHVYGQALAAIGQKFERLL